MRIEIAGYGATSVVYKAAVPSQVDEKGNIVWENVAIKKV